MRARKSLCGHPNWLSFSEMHEFILNDWKNPANRKLWCKTPLFAKRWWTSWRLLKAFEKAWNRWLAEKAVALRHYSLTNLNVNTRFRGEATFYRYSSKCWAGNRGCLSLHQKRFTHQCVDLVSRDLPKDSIAFFIAVTMPIGSRKWFLWRRNPSFDYSKLPHSLYYHRGYCLYSSCTTWTSAVAKGEGTTLMIPVVVTCANCSWNTFLIEPAHLHLENLQSGHLVRLSLKVINRPLTALADRFSLAG